MSKTAYVPPKFVRLDGDGLPNPRCVSLRVGQRVRWTDRDNSKHVGTVTGINGYDHDDTAQFREVAIVHCDDGIVRRPIVNNVPVYLV